MRRVTRNAVVLVLVVVVVLLALGALPSLLETGDPYYLTAETVEPSPGVASVNASGLSERRFPYTVEALRNGTSDPYWRGPAGVKESFAHSPFDELSALRERNTSAAADGGVVVSHNATLYRLAVRQRP